MGYKQNHQDHLDKLTRLWREYGEASGKYDKIEQKLESLPSAGRPPKNAKAPKQKLSARKRVTPTIVSKEAGSINGRALNKGPRLDSKVRRRRHPKPGEGSDAAVDFRSSDSRTATGKVNDHAARNHDGSVRDPSGQVTDEMDLYSADPTVAISSGSNGLQTIAEESSERDSIRTDTGTVRNDVKKAGK